MRIAIVGSGGIERHPPTRALGRAYGAAGHQVDIHPRLEPDTRIAADLVVPAIRGDVTLAEGVLPPGATVAAPPGWQPDPATDIAWAAPGDLRWSSSPAGPGLSLHLEPAADATPGTTPAPARHRGRRLGLVRRPTATTPARYLEAGLRRAGVDLVVTARIDWTRLTDTEAVVIVESMLPAFPEIGDNPGIPVLFWAHHGEHHTAMHRRLVRRYRADAVLLAHSWHLAHHFDIPVHRFPFGIPTELVDGSRPWVDRAFDVAFVGAGVEGGGAYSRRGAMLDALRSHTDRIRAVSGVTPDELAAVYGNARVVPNEGGDRHRPITMRVPETIGSGALLVTALAPGLDRLFRPGSHLISVPDDVDALVTGVLDGLAEGASVAAAGFAHGMGHHTVDHRVDDLFEILAVTDHRHRSTVAPSADPLVRLLDDDPLLDDVICPEVVWEEVFTDRTVWAADRLDRYAGKPLAHAAVVPADWPVDADLLARAVRRVIVADPSRRDVVEAARRHHPDTVVETHPGALRIDFGVAGYRVMP